MKGASLIANQSSRSGRTPHPIRIQAQVLRDTQGFLGAGPTLDIKLPDAGATPASPAASGKPHWRQADVRRAIAAAEAAGLRGYRVEIAPDGTISLVVGAGAEPSAAPCRGSDAEPEG